MKIIFIVIFSFSMFGCNIQNRNNVDNKLEKIDGIYWDGMQHENKNKPEEKLCQA
jgi:hypothetical protein